MKGKFWRCLRLGIILVGLVVLLPVEDAGAGADAVLAQGPIAGAVTDTRATIWVRTSGPGQVILLVSTDKNLTDATWSQLKRTVPKKDFTARIKLTNLTPVTTYYYRVVVDGISQTKPPYPHFTTFATPGTPTAFRFGITTDFGSIGAAKGQKPKLYDTFKNLVRDDPAFVVMGGDFWHNEVDPPWNPALDEQAFITQTRSRYAAMYSYSSYLGPYDYFVGKLLPNFALAHFWDDHDIGRNNATKYYRFKNQSLRVLKEFFPTYPMSYYGDWQRFSYGQADFFILDARSQRDPGSDPDGPDKSMLDGDNLGQDGQWAWLSDNLLNSTARWKIIFSPVTFNPTMSKMDAWYGYPSERARLLEFISANNITDVFVISGDSHGGAIDDGTNSGMPEMLVPGPNMKGSCFTSRDTGMWSHGIYGQVANKGCRGYALVDIMTDPDRALLRVKDEFGQVKLEMELQ